MFSVQFSVLSRKKRAGAAGSLLLVRIRHSQTSRHWHSRDLPSWLHWRRGLVLNIVAHFRKKTFSPHDITPRDGGEDVGNDNPPFILAGKWPSSAAKWSSRAAKCGVGAPNG